MPPRADTITRKQRETWARDRDRERLTVLRNALKGARGTRRDRIAAVRAACKAERERLRAQALEQQRALRESIQRMRTEARKLCSQNAETAQRDAGAAIAQAIAALTEEQSRQHVQKLWQRPPFCPVRGPSRKGEARQESDCEVAQNLTDPMLLPVWERVKHRIKGTARKTRTEAFLEWVEEHAAEVAEIQAAAIEASVQELEREEAETRKRLGVGYRSLSDRQLDTLTSSSSAEGLPVEPEPRTPPMGPWFQWSARGAGPVRAFRYRVDRAGPVEGLPPWSDFGSVDARNGQDAAALVAQHVAEHHAADAPFPAWLELDDWTTRTGGKLVFYLRGPGEAPTWWDKVTTDLGPELQADAERLRMEQAEARAELEREGPKRAAKGRRKARKSPSLPAPPPSDRPVGLPFGVAVYSAGGATDWARGTVHGGTHEGSARLGLETLPHVTFPSRVNVETLTPDGRNTGDVATFWAPKRGELLRIGSDISDAEVLELEQRAQKKAARRPATEKARATREANAADRRRSEAAQAREDARQLEQLEQRAGITAREVLRATEARDVERFHDDRAFIASVYDHLHKRGRYTGTLAEFKRVLWEMFVTQGSGIRLTRAELVGVMDPELVERSEYGRHGATVHFIATPAPLPF
jgi:hypothetical protein